MKNKDLVTIEFKITGGGYEERANPMPKLRYTGKQSWLPRVQNYVIWKHHVQNSFIEALQENEGIPEGWGKKALRMAVNGNKPLDTGKQPVVMHVHIGWRGFAHADPEGVFGSIADAIFKNDKYLSGSFTYTHLVKTAIPYVTVSIQVPHNAYDE